VFPDHLLYLEAVGMSLTDVGQELFPRWEYELEGHSIGSYFPHKVIILKGSIAVDVLTLTDLALLEQGVHVRGLVYFHESLFAKGIELWKTAPEWLGFRLACNDARIPRVPVNARAFIHH
jgi:hypothetical protein